MNRKCSKRFIAILLAMMTVFMVSCGSAESEPAEETKEGAVQEEGAEEENGQSPEAGASAGNTSSFAAAHDAFKTTLAREENDDDPIPAPPEGVFDLVSYPSKVGDLAAYVSSDPGDGEKHPLIIWVVGGWGNGIDDFPWIYPEWDDDQTGSAFWQEGILTMYPSFRGGNGNPGYYEALFGEVDDIVSAYEYAASLPYVDPERIYLGGHSTGGTRALLASEYTDCFRAVFCFGAVDEIIYHNNDQFTFDTDNEEEYAMRSPIHWLDDIKSPTFLIEGRDGNAECLERMEAASENENIHCYVMEGQDHFSVLAPATRLVAQKILEDTGDEANISITQEELEEAMKKLPTAPKPVMVEHHLEEMGLTFSCPYVWEITENEAGNGVDVYSVYDYDNAWDMSSLFMAVYDAESENDLKIMSKAMESQGYIVSEIEVDGHPAMDAVDVFESDSGAIYYQRYVSIENGDQLVDLNFITFSDFMDEADLVFQDVIDSIVFDD